MRGDDIERAMGEAAGGMALEVVALYLPAAAELLEHRVRLRSSSAEDPGIDTAHARRSRR